MSQRWRYLEQGADGQPVAVEMSEREILDTYYPYWQEQMRRVGKSEEISPRGVH